MINPNLALGRPPKTLSRNNFTTYVFVKTYRSDGSNKVVSQCGQCGSKGRVCAQLTTLKLNQRAIVKALLADGLHTCAVQQTVRTASIRTGDGRSDKKSRVIQTDTSLLHKQPETAFWIDGQK